MPRRPRADEAGGFYHALNSGNSRLTVFQKDEGYAAFGKVLSDGLELDAELQAIRTSAQRGSPFGEASWIGSTAKRLSLESSLRPRGHPRVHFDPEAEYNES